MKSSPHVKSAVYQPVILNPSGSEVPEEQDSEPIRHTRLGKNTEQATQEEEKATITDPALSEEPVQVRQHTRRSAPQTQFGPEIWAAGRALLQVIIFIVLQKRARKVSHIPALLKSHWMAMVITLVTMVLPDPFSDALLVLSFLVTLLGDVAAEDRTEKSQKK